MPTLDWLTKTSDMRFAHEVPSRLLVPVASLSFGEPSLGNVLVQGDNLQALASLRPQFAGAVRCVFIDPPYNTRSAFENYDDNLEHTEWLSMMYPRLAMLREFLRQDGSIWISMDDNEAHYLKVMLDEIFGRSNFVANVVWQKRTSPDARVTLGDAHDHILVYARSKPQLRLNRVQRSEADLRGFSNPDLDPRGIWSSTDFTAQGWRPNQMYTIRTPGGTDYSPPTSRCWQATEPEFLRLVSENRIWFGRSGKARPRIKTFFSESQGVTTWTWWTNKEVGHNQEAKKESIELFGPGAAFETPKPERLVRRVIELATDPGDIVLDSFLGSGTTAAVAHKLGRRYVGVENGEHAQTHCVVRLRKVIEGERGGISTTVQWNGGGGFSFYKLGNQVIDDYGQLDSGITYDQLAAHLWFTATGLALSAPVAPPLIGEHAGTSYFLLFSRSPNGSIGNELSRRDLAKLSGHSGNKVVFAESTKVSHDRLKAHRIEFRQLPYDLTAH